MSASVIIYELLDRISGEEGFLWQYDYGQKMRFIGIDLPASYTVHFANSSRGASVPSIGDETGVRIPDQVLLSGKPVFFYLFLHNSEDDGQTAYANIINVHPRANMPTIDPPTPEQQSILDELMAALNAGIDHVDNIAENVPQIVDDEIAAAKARGDFKGDPGAVFTPEMHDGVMTWSNDGGLPNPEPTNFNVELGLDNFATKQELSGKVDNGKIGQPNGVAALDETGHVPSELLPSYVDDIIEYPSLSQFPNPGESGKIYISTSNNHQYRWTGSQYIDMTSSDLSTKADKRDTVLETTLSRGRADYGETGTGSIAFGTSARASGDYSVATGATVDATGDCSHAEGSYTVASGSKAHAEGTMTYATNEATHAEGDHATASGYIAHAEGYYTLASGDESHAEGNNTQAQGIHAHAEGNYTKARGNDTHAENSFTEANGNCSHSEGYFTIANGSYSHVGGMRNIPDSYDNTNWPEWVQGEHCVPGDKRKHTEVVDGQTVVNGFICITENTDSEWNSTHWEDQYGRMNYAVIIGNGGNNCSNAYTLDWDGNEEIAGKFIGHGMKFGAYAFPTGTNSIAVSNGATASGENSIAISGGATASGYDAIAVGGGATASGHAAVAIGAGVTASGNCSHAYGSGTTASGSDSVACGGGSQANGSYSFASGEYSVANGTATHTFGMFNIPDVAPDYDGWNEWIAGTPYSVGANVYRDITTTYHDDDREWSTTRTHYYTCKEANTDQVFDESKWDETYYGRSDKVEIVGGGLDTEHQANIRALDWHGNEFLSGDIYVRCNPDGTGGTKLEPIVYTTLADAQEIINGYGVSA